MPPRKTDSATPEEPGQAGQPGQEAEPTPEAYEAARMALVAKLPPKDQRPTTIYGKLALATSLIGQVKKTGRNTFHNYTYARESDLVEAIRPLLSELGLWIHWTLFSDPEKGVIHHQRVSLTKKKDGDSYEAESLTIVAALFKFYDETGTCTEPQLMMGYGDDNSDKGLSKALTGMEKYFLFKSFLVSTGDDPEADSRADQRAARREGGLASRVQVQRGSGPTPAAGGRQAEPTNPQIKQLGDLTRAAGIRSLVDTITLYERILEPTKVGPLDAEDLAGSLLAWIKAQPGPVIGRLIHDIRGLIDAGRDRESPTVEPAAPAETPSEGAQEPVDDSLVADDEVE